MARPRPLTDIGIRNLKAGAARREIPDPGARGLYVVVQPSGAKSYAVRYRFGGRPRKLTLTSGISLAAARKETGDALYQVQQGHDPAIAKRRARQEQLIATGSTFRAVAEEYLKREGGRLRSVGERRKTLERLVYKELGNRPIGEIRRSEIIRLLDKIEAGELKHPDTGKSLKGGAVMADRTLAYIRRVMNWHATRSDDFASPIVRGMARVKAKERERERILTDDEIRAVWAAADATEGPFGSYLQFLLLTAARRNEAARMLRTEIASAPQPYDGTAWTLPAARNKAKVDLVRPLTEVAQSVLARVPKIAGCEFVFSTDGEHPITASSRAKEKFDKASGVNGWTLHDLRRTARSLMSRAGIDADHAERCLGHVIGGVRGVYDRYEYYNEKKRAYEALAAQIQRIMNPQENVVSLRKGIT